MCKFEPAHSSPRLHSSISSRLPVSLCLSPKYGRVIKSAYISINKWEARKFHPPLSEKNRERMRKGYPLVDNIALVLVDVDVVILFFFFCPHLHILSLPFTLYFSSCLIMLYFFFAFSFHPPLTFGYHSTTFFLQFFLKVYSTLSAIYQRTSFYELPDSPEGYGDK